MNITCVTKSDRFNPHERITHLGGFYSNGHRWLWPQEWVIQAIESGQYRFFVQRGLATAVEVEVSISQWGHKYIKTKADFYHPDNLLSLSECPLYA